MRIVPNESNNAVLIYATLSEYDTVKAMLRKEGGNVTRAAERAGVSRRFLQRTIARLGIKASDVGADPRDLEGEDE